MKPYNTILMVPVTDKKNGVVLLDIFIDGKGKGSRSTYKQCMMFLQSRGYL